LIRQLKNKHFDEPIAILGSGPSLELYCGDPVTAIAVNGGADATRPYSYFMCGDINSPTRDWFLSSKVCGATRIIASFLAPSDPILYPDPVDREKILAKSTVHKYPYLGHRKLEYYSFRPVVKPKSPHLYYRYNGLGNTNEPGRLSGGFWRREPRFYRGATISGVAVQLAEYMGCREIHLFGVDMNNFDGSTYLNPQNNIGKTRDNQIEKLRALTTKIRALGVSITFHGENRSQL
jgi:hypothetical protein